MPIVEVIQPDGSTVEVEFPDSMTAEQIAATLRSNPPRPAQPSLNLPGPPDLLELAQRVPDAFGSDLVTQGIGTIAGTALGAVGGPLGAALGGAAGNVLGRMASHHFRGERQPSGSQMLVDAAIGASGPALSAAARPLSRAALGVSRPALKTVREAVDTAQHAARRAEDAAKAAERARRSRAGFETQEAMRAEARADVAAAAAKSAEAAKKTAAETAAETAGTAGRLAEAIANYGGIAAAAARGDLTSAAVVFGLGHSLSAAQKAAARKLLQNDRIVKWLTEKGPALAAKGQTGLTIPILLGEKWLSARDRQNLERLRRNDRGQFVPRAKPAIDHSELEKLFGGGPT